MKKKKSEAQKVYEKLKKDGLSDAEIAESFIFPVKLSPEELKKANIELAKARAKHKGKL
jgi:hypothetical protein